MIRHSADPICTYCEMKLLSAHPEFSMWWTVVKKKYPDLHISETYRNKADQDRDVAAGKSNTPWPTSYHNKVDPQGKPCSLAVDVFIMNKDHPQGCWGALLVTTCKAVFEELKDQFPQFSWGGNWKSKLVDQDHFQIELDDTTGACALPVLED